MILRLIEAPIIEPVMLEDPAIKEYLRLDGTESDNSIQKLLKTAREKAEKFQNRAYLTQTWELCFDSFPPMPLEIPKPPLQSLVYVKVYDSDDTEISMNTGDFIVDSDSEPGRITFKNGKSWPSVVLRKINAVKIQFKAGYTDAEKVPELVKTAILIYTAYRHEHPDEGDVPDAFYNLLWPDRVVPV